MAYIEYEAEVCDHCGQTTTYALAINHGAVDIVKTIAIFIGEKGINIVHPMKEMQGKTLTANQICNLSNPRFHGLIAHVKGNAGNYALTQKGVDFLNGSPIPKVAIVSKSEKRLLGYYLPEKLTCTIDEFGKQDGSLYWQGMGYHISEGKVIKNTHDDTITI